MASSYLNIITFLLTTLFYYMALKPTYTYKMSIDPTQNNNYLSNSYLYLAIYLLLVIVIQFMVNASIISSNCGGSITENLGASGILTFIPWILIFGVLTVVLTIFPGFKSAFSDVIGYYWVSSSANNLLTKLLINQNVENALNSDNTGQGVLDSTPSAPPASALPSAPPASALPPSYEEAINMKGGKKNFKGGAITKQQVQEAADTIVKICGNTSILINQIVPSNFNEYWNILTPLMKEQYQEDESMKTKLFDIVVTRDNIGEAMWYIYTGLLLTSLVQLKMTTRGCTSNLQTQEQNYQKFLESEQQAKSKNELATSTTYTITN
jgi:type VI protein secretion system component Hcp